MSVADTKGLELSGTAGTSGIDRGSYEPLRDPPGVYYASLVFVIVLALIGFYCAYTVEHAGHHITGMTNQVIWGLPHVFAISLIVTASGALNAATLASVFGRVDFKPWARLSVVLAITLLSGGLLVLVLDLGRPDRLIVALTHYNFLSIFSWNIFLYTGFIVLGIVYLWMMMERRFNYLVGLTGKVVLLWRIALTSGTGSIFGFLVARNALDTAILAPLFIALSLVMGSAVFCLLLLLLPQRRRVESHSDPGILLSHRKILIWFLLALAYLSLVHHVTNLYVAEHSDTEAYLIAGPMSAWFWIGHVILGLIAPLLLLTCRLPTTSQAFERRLALACLLSVIGGWCLLYTIIVASQMTPQILFGDKIVLSSSFGDSGYASYTASIWEWGLGLGGIAVAALLCLLAVRLLPFLPMKLTQRLR